MSLIRSVRGGVTPAREALPLARAAAERTLELDPESQEAQAVLGVVAAVYEFDWKEAERRFRLATAREPVPPCVRWYYPFAYLLPMGRLQESVDQCRRGLEDDPMNFTGRLHCAVALLAAGSEEAGEAQLRELCELHPNLYQPFYLLGLSQTLRGLHPEALASAENAHSLAPWNTNSTGLFAGALARAGQGHRAEELLRELHPGDQYGAPMALLLFHLVCSEMDRAADWAWKVFEQRDVVH
jgi:tetratricopeptide (TPR) repeat protein